MRSTLLRAEDYKRSGSGNLQNSYWEGLVRTIEQFDQLIEIQKKEISQYLKQQQQKRTALAKQFYEFKESLKFQGDVPKREIQFVGITQFPSFFSGYHHSIIELIQKIVLQPQNMVKILLAYKDTKRIKFSDFFQNVPFNIYCSYLPIEQSYSSTFIRQIIQAWPYNLELARPTQYSLLDEIITAYLKYPTVICYVQRITSKFLIEVSKCRTDIFAFDEDAIRNQIDIKKHPTFSHNSPVKSKWKFWKWGKDDSQINNMPDRDSAEQDYSSVSEMMRKRQASFVEVIKKTVQSILKEEVPQLLRKMFQYFHEKLGKNASVKHYCYFFMTNLIFAELHNKFTMSHEETRMTHADLQNISEIVRILSCIFQGVRPEGDKYKYIAINFKGYTTAVDLFYQRLLAPEDTLEPQVDTLRTNLLEYFQNCVILSFNDIKCIVEMVSNCDETVLAEVLSNPKKTLQFLVDPDIQRLYEAKAQVRYNHGTYMGEHLFFAFESKALSSKDVIEKYMCVERPLEQIALIKNIFFHESNLSVRESIEINQNWRALQEMPIKQIRLYVLKMASKFKHLQVRNSRELDLKFQNQFRNTLGKALQRKEWLLFNRSQISCQMNAVGRLMEFYSKELNSAQFYERISDSFIANITIKIYLAIENDLFKVSINEQELRKLQISDLLIITNQGKSQNNQQNFILRRSFKMFESIMELLKCIAKNEITKAALQWGRKTEMFNATFQSICTIVISHIEQFIRKKAILQALSQEKIALIVLRKMQDFIVEKCAPEAILKADKQLREQAQLIDKNGFYEKDLKAHEIEKNFLVEQGVSKFKLIMTQTSIRQRGKHFAELFKIIFTVLGFTMAKNKISAEIVNPIMQYIILQCPQLPHHECLYSLQCLKWKDNPEENYNLILYQSSLAYIVDSMAADYPLPHP